MLGLGLGLNKNTAFKKYALDYIPGGVENNVLWLSYYQMTGRRNDECFRLRDLTTSDEWDIGRIDGYVDYQHVLNLLNGHTGLAAKIYNNSWVIGAQDAIQVNVANMPVVAQAGNFNHDGFKFDATNLISMRIIDYAAIDFINPPFSIYSNSSNHGIGYFLLCKNYDSTPSTQYSIFKDPVNRINMHLEGTLSVTGGVFTLPDKSILVWKDKNIDGCMINQNGSTYLGTFGTSLTNSQYVTLGARSNSTDYSLLTSYCTFDMKTMAISADNLYSYYNILAARC
jgi:hypothetical protein